MGRVIEVRGDACLAAAMNWCFVDSCQFFLGKSWGFIWLLIRTFGCSLLIYDMHRYINPLNFQLCSGATIAHFSEAPLGTCFIGECFMVRVQQWQPY